MLCSDPTSAIECETLLPCVYLPNFSLQGNNLWYRSPSSTLRALIGTSAKIAFNKYPHKPYIFLKAYIIVPDYCLFLLKNQNINAIQK